MDGGAVKKTLAHSTRENKSNNLEPHFPNFSDKVAVPRWHEICCRFATLQGEHQRLDRRVVDFSIRGDAGVMAETRNVVRKKNGGRGASSRGFVRKIGLNTGVWTAVIRDAVHGLSIVA